MTTATLTSRQRLQRALEHRDHDRVPRYDAFWTETLARFIDEGLAGRPDDAFGFDMDKISHYAPVPFPGRHEVIHEDADTVAFVNAYGVRQRRWKNRSGVPEHLGCECVTPDIWRKTFKPRFADPFVDLDQLKARHAVAYDAARWICVGTRGVFSFVQTLVGDDVLLMAMADDPQWTIDMFQTVTGAFIAMLQKALDAGLEIDGLWVADDQAYRNGPFMSPAMYRQQIWPCHKRLADFAHVNEMDMILHTDGDVRMLIDDFLAAGINALQPLEAKAGLDVRLLAPTIGDRVSLFGNIDMTVAITNDRAKVEYEVTEKLRAGMKTRGYIYHSDHSVPPQVSLATYRFIHDVLDREGNYR